MLNLGTGEVLAILALALIIFGPDKLPGIARQAGRVLTEIRRMSSNFQTELRDAFYEAEQPGAAASPEEPATRRQPPPDSVPPPPPEAPPLHAPRPAARDPRTGTADRHHGPDGASAQ